MKRTGPKRKTPLAQGDKPLERKPLARKVPVAKEGNGLARRSPPRAKPGRAPREGSRGPAGACPVCGRGQVKGRNGSLLKTCGSRDCANELRRRAKLGNANPARVRASRDPGPRDKFGNRTVPVICPVCGEEFQVPRSGKKYRKTCSRRCAGRLHSARISGTGNPGFRHGAYAGRASAEESRRWQSGLAPQCEVPGCGFTLALAQHHVVYRQHVRREGGDEFDPSNSMTLCRNHHATHHSRQAVIPLASLPDAALTFAFKLLGPAASDYLWRYYDGDDPRLEQHLRRSQDAGR